MADEDRDATTELPAQLEAPTRTEVAAGAAATIPPHRPGPLAPGARVGRYVVRGEIASGGGGTVFAAEAADDPAQRVAIKVLLGHLAASPLALSRFAREAEVVGLIDHPNIVPVLDAGELPDGRPFIVMELVAAETLKHLLERRGRLAPPEAREILEPICSALIAAHGAGVIHRDLKASNISIGESPAGDPIVRLLDFGIAKLVLTDPSQGLTAQGARLGTPHAMAPEQIRGDAVDERVDIYSLGVLAYQMLTGSYPFAAATVQEIERLHLQAEPPRPSAAAPVSPALDQVVLRCLAKDPEARFASVPEFLAAFREAVNGPTGAPHPGEDAPRAVALKIELPAGGDEDAAAATLDEVEETLRRAGFDLPVQAGNLVVAAHLLAPEPGQAHVMIGDALALGRDLGARLGVIVALHVADAAVRGGQVVGGPILRLPGWVVVRTLNGVGLTGDVPADLG